MTTVLTLSSGFSFDYTNLFGAGRVTAADVAALAPRLLAAHRAVEEMRRTGFVRGHRSKDGAPEKVLFSSLPYVAEGHLNSPASLQKLKAFGEEVRREVDVVVSLGIGGSYLGNKVLFDVTGGAFWNEKSKEARGGWPEVYFSGNNMDPRRTVDLIAHLIRRGARMKSHAGRSLSVLLLVISKSGGTLDTMSNFMLLYDRLGKAADIRLSVAAVTDPDDERPTLLHRLAAEKGWRMFSVPDGVGGRFSVFSEVGLSLAACIGFDMDGFLAGARAMDGHCRGADVWQNPAMLNAALKYIAAETYGRDIEVMMPYGDDLKSLAEWYVQLLAESLGKERDRAGRVVHYGRTPMVAVGTTDMHAQTQQHQEGRLNKVVQFLRVERWSEDLAVPDVFPGKAQLSAIAGVTLGEALEAARQSNAEALTGNGRFNSLFSLPALTPYHLGEVMYLLALSVAYEGELADVDAFDQPGVEAYKKVLGPRLAAIRAAAERRASCPSA
ncbi:MAG: glucose-6-phosphate isomerase [Schwartzia sp. (in: firmicutes)]